MTGLEANLKRYLAIGKSSNLQGRFLRATSGSFLLKIASASLRIITSVLLARLLGVDQLGVFAFALSIVTIVAIPVDLGLPQVVTRSMAVYDSLHNWSAMRGLLLRANSLVLGISALIVMLTASVTLMTDISQDDLYVFLAALAALPFIALGALRRGSLIGLHRPVTAQFPEAIIQPVMFVMALGVGALLMKPPEFSPTVAMGLRVFTFVVAFCAGHFLLLRFLPAQVKQVSASFETSGWLRGALAFMLLGGLATLNAHAGIVMLGFLGSNEDVGVYKVVVVLSGTVIFVLQAVNLTLSPMVAKLHAEGDKKRLQNIVTLASRVLLLCGLPVSILFVLFGEWLLLWLYGTQFTQGAVALAILCLGQLANAATGPVGMVLNMSGYERDTIKGQVTGAALNVVLGAVLIPVWDINGAALAAACSLVTSNIILVTLAYRRLGLHSTAFGKLSFTRAT